MSLIAPQRRPDREPLTCRLDARLAQLLKCYADFIRSRPDYIVNQALLVTFSRGREFQTWLGTSILTTRCGSGTSSRNNRVAGPGAPSTRPSHQRGSSAMAGSKRALPNDRTVISLAVSAVVGAVLLRTYRFPGDASLLAIIHWRAPWLYTTFHAKYVTLAFTTPLIVVSLFATLAYVFWVRWDRRPRAGRLPLFPRPQARDAVGLVLGEVHHPTNPCEWQSGPACGSCRTCGSRQRRDRLPRGACEMPDETGISHSFHKAIIMFAGTEEALAVETPTMRQCWCTQTLSGAPFGPTG